jgi:hypothetical protein
MSNPKGNVDTLKPYQPKWQSGATQTIRVPVALADELMTIARKLDAGEPSPAALDLTDAAVAVLADTTVTRNGKDSGAVKRALKALMKVYQCKPLQAESRALER